jgi:hypothetical protein
MTAVENQVKEIREDIGHDGNLEDFLVEIGDADVSETYDPGDSVIIVGRIDDLVENEDVIIKIMDPSGSVKKTQSIEPNQDGFFDYVYDIPSTATDGVWQVEAEYSGDKMYVYFIVDDDADAIAVGLDNIDSIYEAGDEVAISGLVDKPADSEENVKITVLDPTNDAIVDEQEVQLDGDEFEFSFELDNDAHIGRYAVIVTYDVNDQEGSALFEIRENDQGSSCTGGDNDSDGDLFAGLGADKYAPGDTVCLTGSIDNFDSGDNEDLTIVVEDPDGEEVDDYGDGDASILSNGDFEFVFGLHDDAPEGTYSIIISYSNDEIALTFEVNEDGGGSNRRFVQLHDDSEGNGKGWNPSGTFFAISEPNVSANSIIDFTINNPENNPYILRNLGGCNVVKIKEGEGFVISCTSGVLNGATLNYAVTNS